VRRLLRFSVRFLLIATAVFAVFMAYTFRQWKQREAAVAYVSELGGIGIVHVEGFEWFRSLIGEETYFHNMKHVVLGPIAGCPRPVRDAEIRELIPLIQASSEFRAHALIETDVTDEGVRIIADLDRIHRLRLTLSARITDSCVPAIKKLSELKELHVDKTNLSREAVAELKQALPNCTIISDF
jgi:hypothetical protein